ncbi:MAG: sucC [Alphaproteobacteria bacterium]|jgi:succinyl-CoA synthetase beta subunit|nr:sucC [Alphaproteobacteria bacterium]MDF3033958.1 sucC [Alphaproteobacteria bacterium]
MNIHEYQAKSILATYGIPLLRGKVANTVEEALKVASELEGTLWVVKAQVHAGGRGKAGGVVLCRSLDEVRQAAQRLLGSRLVTPQTGPKGQDVKRLYIEEGCDIVQELYLSLVVDRVRQCLSFMVSDAGGMDIEEVSEKNPEKILTLPIDPASGFQPYHGRKLAYSLGLGGKAAERMGYLARNLYKSFEDLDMSLIEINPLVVTKADDLVALDAKITFDDNGLFRHPEIEQLRDEDEEDAVELEANRQGLSYVKLDGNIGCMVNGAGLAMATMDIIKLHGASPANFLDVGGGASRDKVAAAFKLILADPSVEAILINIFGGIMRCDIIAEGIISAAKEMQLMVPMVVRLQGTNEKEGKQILAASSLSIIPADDLGEAAMKIAQAVREAV